MLQLTDTERDELQGLMRRAKDPHVRIKATALWNLAQGKTRREVAGFLGTTVLSVTNWTK